jgi:hypothetical protein
MLIPLESIYEISPDENNKQMEYQSRQDVLEQSADSVGSRFWDTILRDFLNKVRWGHS